MKISHFKLQAIRSVLFLTVALIFFSSNIYTQQKPVDYFGFEPGSEGNLFTYEELIKYLQEVDAASLTWTSQNQTGF